MALVVFVAVSFFVVTIAHACTRDYAPSYSHAVSDSQSSGVRAGAEPAAATMQGSSPCENKENPCKGFRDRMLSLQPALSQADSITLFHSAPLAGVEIPKQMPMLALRPPSNDAAARSPQPFFISYSALRI